MRGFIMKKHFISAFLALTLLLCVPLSASAHPVPDMTRKGSITVSMTYQNKPVPGGSLKLYRVGNVHEDDGNYSFKPVDALDGLISEFGDIQSPELAGTLTGYAAQKKLGSKSAAIGQNGTAVFSELQLGLYLVVQDTAASGYEKTTPFLVSVPYLDDGTYVYDVQSDPKTELEREVKPTTPTTPHSSSGSGGKLAQTGQLWWPVPVLICGGLGCIVVGLYRRRRGQNED